MPINLKSLSLPGKVGPKYEALHTDSLLIQQYWDPTKTISITQDQQQATGIYYFPGYFRAKLLVAGRSVREHDLFLKSDGWLGTIEYEPVPKYFDPIVLNYSGLKCPQEVVEEVAGRDQPISTVFHYVNDLGQVSGDNFSFKTTIQNTFDDRWAVCQSMRIYFIGTEGAMIIPFAKIGCSSENNLMLNDKYLSGKKHDLSDFSADFTEPTELEIRVNNKQVVVKIDDKTVYALAYNKSVGRLVGLRFKFKGIGEVLDFEIIDGENKDVVL